MSKAIFEFPEGTSELIDKLANYLSISRAEVFTKALGLLNLWMLADSQGGALIERILYKDTEILVRDENNI